MPTPNLNLTLPTEGGSEDTWGSLLNTALTTIDTFAGVPGFIANRNGTQQTGLTAGTSVGNKIAFNNEVRDDGGYYDNSTYRFTPLIAGIYRATLSVATETGTSNESHAAQIWKNGALAAESNYFAPGMLAGPGSPRLLVSQDIVFNGSTDYIEPFVYLPAGVTAISGINNITYFSAYKVRDLS